MLKLLETREIQKGSRKDTVTDYIFENNFPMYEDLVKELHKITGYESVEKGKETWLECTHYMLRVDKDTITMRFVKPYCG